LGTLKANIQSAKAQDLIKIPNLKEQLLESSKHQFKSEQRIDFTSQTSWAEIAEQ
jgi:hypothetical protein